MNIVAVEEYWNEIVKSRSLPFIGLILRVPPRFWREMSVIQNQLKLIDRRQVYAKPSTFHVTIKGLGFLGEKFNQSKLETMFREIHSMTASLSPFNIRFKGLRVFPTSIYVGVEDPSDQLRMLNKMISDRFGKEIDSSEYDGNAYIPHITLATFATKDADDLLRKVDTPSMRELDFGECRVFEVEAVEASLFFALGPEDTQDRAFGYLRSFQLGN